MQLVALESKGAAFIFQKGAADVIANAQSLLTMLLRAMFIVGYFPPDTPPE
jgi:hypothetical protein